MVAGVPSLRTPGATFLGRWRIRGGSAVAELPAYGDEGTGPFSREFKRWP